jgi:para-aminobenzoate synthetase / 4-amino-4-deoxychorismate lyase
MRKDFVAILRTPFGGPWRRFSRPSKVVVATHVEDVRRAVEEVDAAVAGGLYAAGFVTYEAAGAFGLPARDGRESLPLVCFGLFPPEQIETLSRFPASDDAEPIAWQPSITHDEYLGAIAAIKERIAAGDTYQINFTFRLNGRFTGDPRALMAELYAAQAGPWSAYVETTDYAICSASPELFYVRDGDRIECHPMKGTAPRGWWPVQDIERGETLRASEKNRAENVMIVDMVRNDLGRIARTGSVTADPLFDVTRYPLQWQMTSRVTAEAPGATLGSLFAAMFPSGSVTGAPKHSAMGIIRELETTPRGVYTGAIGYLSPHGRAHFNVAIRTVVVDRHRHEAEFGVGSGVVWDSVDRDEYDECLVKAAMVTGSRFRGQGSGFKVQAVPSYVVGERPDFSLLETIGWTPADGFALLNRHLHRLRLSAECFGFVYDEDEVRNVLKDAVVDLHKPAKVRVLLGGDGTLACEALDLLPVEGPLRAELAPTPVDTANVFLFHKTTRRAVYEAARASRPDADAVILWNASGDVTEGTDYNLVAEIGGRKVTPPIECGLLPGTFRAELLANGEIAERRITVEELRAAPRVWLINSVRGWVECQLA